MAWNNRSATLNSVNSLINREYGRNLCEGEDKSSIKSLVRARFDVAKNLFRKDLFSHFGCVNAIEFSNDGEWLVSGGDDRRVLLWNMEETISGSCLPKIMKGEHMSNIFCLSFDSRNNKLFSAGNDDKVIVHDSSTGETLDVILHDEAIYSISVEPGNDNVFATACDDGRVFIWDLRAPSTRDPLILMRSNSAYHAVMYNPVEPRLISAANSKEGIGLWDVRRPKTCLLQYNGCLSNSQSAMSVRFNSRGTQILGLRRRLPPILYNITSPFPMAEFDDTSYYNSCTMKSCCFAGDEDQYILSGSDNFKLYMWKIPSCLFDEELSQPKTSLWVEKASLVLRGHRSIVNQVRYNYSNFVIASSGVEKVIKLWSVFPLPIGKGGIDESLQNVKENRKVYSHEDYINLVLESGHFMTHDYSHRSCQEDPRMMAFFDSLVQRDIEGWSDSDEDSDGRITPGRYEFCFNLSGPSGVSSNDDGEQDSSSDNNSTNEEADDILNSHTTSYISLLSQRLQVQNRSSTSILPSTSNDLNNVINSENTINDVNKISQLINDKKRDQLKKVARVTLTSTRKRLKKAMRSLKKRSNSCPQSSQINVKTENKSNEDFKEIQSVLENLSQIVGTSNQANSNGIFSINSRRNTQRLRQRLRYLTNQSDFMLNEVLPEQDSDSDSSNVDVSDDFFEVLQTEVNRMNDFNNENESLSDSTTNNSDGSSSSSSSTKSSSSSSSNSSDSSLKNMVSKNNMQTNSLTLTFTRNFGEIKKKLDDESSCLDNNNDEMDKTVSKNTVIPFKVPNDIEGLEETEKRMSSDIKLGSSSHALNDASTSLTNSTTTFKTVKNLKRSYRKRKLGEDELDIAPIEHDELSSDYC